MRSTNKKNTKSRPSKLTEIFDSPASQSYENRSHSHRRTSSPTPSSKADSIDADSRYLAEPRPITEDTLKKYFNSFRDTLQSDFKQAIGDLREDIRSISSRTEHIENKMANFAKSHNLLIDANSALEEEVQRLSNKVLDLEDRSRRNNIRIRGIPENITPDQLAPFLTDLMALLLPERTNIDFTIDRIHRLPKPRHLPQHLPRDTIARIHFYHIKDELLKVLKSSPTLPERFKDLSIFPDLSAATMIRRKEFAQYTKVLRDNNILYRWGFPVKVIISRNGAQHVCLSPDAMKDLLLTWNLIPPPLQTPPRKEDFRPAFITPLWSGKSSKSRLEKDN